MNKEKIFAIEIRDTIFDFDNYKLILKSENKVYETELTEELIIPKFNISKNNLSIFKILNDENGEGTFNLILMNKLNKTLFEENITLPINLENLPYIEDLILIKNINFPSIILETSKGFYIYNKEEKEKIEYINKDITKTINKTEQLNNLESLSKELDMINKLISINKGLLKEAEDNLKGIIEKYKDKYQHNLQIGKILYDIQNFRDKKEVTNREISQLQELKRNLANFNNKRNEKIKEMENTLKEEENLLNKQKNIDLIKINQSNKKSKKYNKILTNYYMREFSFIFFNKEINNNFIFPSFYSTPSNLLNKESEHYFYRAKSKEISNFLGVILNICIFLSKKYDIILPYVPYYNGSKSKIIDNFGKKELNLYIESKNSEETFLNFRVSIKYIGNIVRSIVSFLIKDDKDSKIHAHDLNNFNLYQLFLVLNQIIYEYNK